MFSFKWTAPGNRALHAVTWTSRTTQPGGKISLEELATAAHPSCFAMVLALCLGEHKAIPPISVGAVLDR